MKLYIVQDGIENACVVDKNSNRIFNTYYFSLTYNLIRNEGYIQKKGENNWRLYTQIGEKKGKSRYYNFPSFEECIRELEILKGDKNISIINQKELSEIIINE